MLQDKANKNKNSVSNGGLQMQLTDKQTEKVGNKPFLPNVIAIKRNDDFFSEFLILKFLKSLDFFDAHKSWNELRTRIM